MARNGRPPGTYRQLAHCTSGGQSGHPVNNTGNYMNFFNRIHETQITRSASRPFEAFIPPHRRLFPLETSQRQRAIARAAAIEVLG
jgi:hypothetical protein